MKILYVTDSHVQARTPSSRTDDFPMAILGQFMELGDIARREGATAIIHGGDMFHSPKVSLKLAGLLAQVILNYPCKMYVVPGNHDVFGHNIDTLDQTVLGLLIHAGVVGLLSRDNPLTLKDDQVSVRFVGQEYHQSIDRRDGNLDYYLDSYHLNYDYNVLVAHGMLLDKPFHPDVPHTLIHNLTCPLPDVMLIGHYHNGLQGWAIKHNDCLFINPGSMGQIEASKFAMNHTPQYVVLEFNNTIVYRIEQFTSAKPGHEVLDRTALEAKQKHTEFLDKFRDIIDEKTNEVVCETLRETINKLAQGTDSKIKSLALATLAGAEGESDEAQNVLGGYCAVEHPLHITSIELKNFQSHEHSILNFDTGLNAIIGASDQGKSAIVRAIRWVLYNEPQGDSFLRVGAKKVECTLTFNDGAQITRQRPIKGSGTYIVKTNKGREQSYSSFGHNVPIDVFNAHQMPKAHLAKDVEVSLNMAYQLDGPFLLTESPATRAAAIGRLVGVQHVDRAIRNINKNLHHRKSIIKDNSVKEEKLKQELEAFNDLPQLERRLKEADALYLEIQQLTTLINYLEGIEVNLNKVMQEIKAIGQIYHRYANLDKAERFLLELERISDEINLVSKLEMAVVDCNEVESKLQDIPDLNKLQTILSELELTETKLEFIVRTERDLDRTINEICRIEAYPHFALDWAQGVAVLQEIEDIDEKLKELNSIINRLAPLSTDIEVSQVKVGQLSVEMESVSEEYLGSLLKTNECPICSGPIEHICTKTILDYLGRECGD